MLALAELEELLLEPDAPDGPPVDEGDALDDVAFVPFRRIALRCRARISALGPGGRRQSHTHHKAREGLRARVVRVDHADAALAARVDVVEPEGRVDVLREDRHGLDGRVRAVARQAEVRVEAVRRGDGLVDRQAWLRERRLGRAVVALRD